MTIYSYTSFMSSPVSVHVAERITCAVVGPPGEWKGRVRFPRWSLIDDPKPSLLHVIRSPDLLHLQMSIYSYTSSMSSHASVPVAEMITCAVVGPP
ncbi:Protein CBG00626 [Caenorhabditis briggsae]|uniref:Protein CBG00626 n=1 Tax=Caenorhabditis briggsae TaxID=6238 RepID=A8WNF2_CAEBR|nr:Protein CBG00626 [Caenorhabditis briggsae]CAP22006.1 Protein CBG00626 [Caenorhabditis briggsae]